MVDERFVVWKKLTIDERVRQKYNVDREQAHLIAQKYLGLALAGLDPGTTIREAYTSEQLDELLDRAAVSIIESTQQRA